MKNYKKNNQMYSYIMKKKMNQYHLVCKAMENKNSNKKINLFILFFFFF